MTPSGIFMKSELVVVISTTFASWHIFTRHNALWLFKNSHHPQFRAVAVSLMPQRVVVFFPLSELFRSLSSTHIFFIIVFNMMKTSYFYSETNQMHQCIKFILFWNDSTCFGRYFRPSSGVHDCTYSDRHLSNRYCCLLASKQTFYLE